MNASMPTRGLYVLTAPSDTESVQALVRNVDEAIRGGAVLVQYRDKHADSETRAQRAQALAGLCRAHAVPLIINDDPELARKVKADGVHLGREDDAPGHARDLLGAGCIIGVSCYNDVERGRRFAQQGVDYLAFGSFYASRIKPDAVRADPAILNAARPLGLPRVAIGGIEPQNAQILIDAGADLIAVISGVFAAADIRASAARYASLFETQASNHT